MWGSDLQIQILEEFADAQRYAGDPTSEEWRAWSMDRERERKSEYRRWRRRSDKNYRLAHSRENMEAVKRKIATDPEFHKKHKEKGKKRMADYMDRIKADPEKFAAFKERKLAYQRARRAKEKNGME